MSTIRITVDCKGALKDLETLKKRIRANTEKLISETIKEATQEAEINASMGSAEGNDNVSVNSETNGLTGFVELTGEDKYFVEFGAGDLTDPKEYEGTFSRSEKGTGEYAKYGSWHHKKVKYTGIAPKKPIYKAARKAEQYIEDHKGDISK